MFIFWCMHGRYSAWDVYSRAIPYILSSTGTSILGGSSKNVFQRTVSVWSFTTTRLWCKLMVLLGLVGCSPLLWREIWTLFRISRLVGRTGWIWAFFCWEIPFYRWTLNVSSLAWSISSWHRKNALVCWSKWHSGDRFRTVLGADREPGHLEAIPGKRSAELEGFIVIPCRLCIWECRREISQTTVWLSEGGT